MKKLSLLLMLFAVTFAFSSCKKDDNKKNQELIVGRWQSTSANYFEVFNSDGTGKMWDEDDDVHENEADTFTWEISSDDNGKFTQIINFHSGGGSVPKMCNIEELNETSFIYNDNGWRRRAVLKRIQ